MFFCFFVVQATYVTKAEGIYIHTSDGKKLIDFNSGAMCANLGHTVPQEILKAVNDQAR
jgi:adenosylmethionine-8-amino-7-oxononanoate aminotransferase